jgi:quinolinate synthase
VSPVISVGDSLQLAREAAKTMPPIIVQAGVHFMAETSKDPRPEKDRAHPGHARRMLARGFDHGRRCAPPQAEISELPVVTYVNTSADVKAESDICCTSSNAVAVVEPRCERKRRRVIMIPDKYLAKNVANQTGIKVIIAWPAVRGARTLLG